MSDDRKITIYPSMILKTSEKARESKCPFVDKYDTCKGDQCMAWVKAFTETSREDHSGGAQMIMEEASFRGVEAVRDGGPGSMGHYTAAAVGFCKRLWKEIQYE